MLYCLGLINISTNKIKTNYKMQKQIIHIGLHKTSSTFLQKNIFPLCEEYQLFTRPFTQLNHWFNRLQYEDASLFDSNGMNSFLENNILKYNKFIISDESLSGKPVGYSYINRTMIAKRLKLFFPSAEIIIFLRDQQDIIKSHYSSYIKMPYGTLKINNFLSVPSIDCTEKIDWLKNPNYNSLYYNSNDYHLNANNFKYTSLIELYKSLFEKVHVFLFEDLTKNPEFIFNRLGNILQTNINYNNHTSKENVSLSNKMLERKRNINKLANLFDSEKMRTIVSKSYKYIPYPILRSHNFDKTIMNMINDYYYDDNEKLKKMCEGIDWDSHPGKYRS